MTGKSANDYEHTIPVAFATENSFCAYTCVALSSVLNHRRKEHFYRFMVLVPADFTQASEDLLRKTVNTYDNCSLEIYNMKGAFDNAHLEISHTKIMTYYRLLLPSILSDCAKCIYLDSDIAVIGDLYELYSVDIEDYYVAGVRAPWYVMQENREGFLSTERYINAGVLVCNLDKIRRDKIDGKFIELSKLEFESQDQDIVNISCYEGILHLPLKFNAMSKFYTWNAEQFKGVFTPEEVKEAWESPVIIHYPGKVKPWHDRFGDLAGYWTVEFKESNIYEDICIIKDSSANIDSDLNYKISVVIPLYNAEKYVKYCLESIVNQTCGSIEIVVIDDGSTDNSLAIIKEYQTRYDFIKLYKQVNQGAGAARNNGIKLACGEFVFFMDPDDWCPEPDAFEVMYDKAISNNVYICGGSTAKFLNEKIVYNFQGEAELKQKFHNESLVYFKDYQYDYGFTRFIYNREFLLDNNIRFPDYPRFQDPPFFVDAMIRAEKFYAVTKVTYCHRINYKKINWTMERVTGLLNGLTDILKMSSDNGLEMLHASTVNRINHWSSELNLSQRITAESLWILELFLKANKMINIELIRKSDEKFRGIKIFTLDVINELINRKNQQVNAPSKISSTSFVSVQNEPVPAGFINRLIKCCKDHGVMYTIKYAFISLPARLRKNV